MKERFAQLRLIGTTPREIRVVHQGRIRVGTPATVSFALERSAAGAATLRVVVPRDGEAPPASEAATVRPGESVSLLLALAARGRLRISVSSAAGGDRATLALAIGAGLVRDHASTIGDTVWVYDVG